MRSLLLVICLSIVCEVSGQPVELSPDHYVRSGVPQGRLIKMPKWRGKVFAGTERDWWVYVPSQYSEGKAAAVMVFQDGHDYVRTNGNWRVPVVFGNLIHKGEMPVTIGVFINPGHNGKHQPKSPWRVSNRSFEYDSLSDQYARFLTHEILGEVGKKYRLTDDPDLRAICGASSRGICSWTVAWEMPDAFRTVVSTIGSFTNIRGGNSYPNLIRKTARKPIRIWLQDGRNDLDN